MLAVGVAPVGVTEWYGDQPFATWPWAQDELGDAQPEVLTDADGLDYERIAALEPDLIIGTNAGLDEESYELLSDDRADDRPPRGRAAATSRRGTTRPASSARRSAGPTRWTAIIADIDAQFAAAAAAHPEFDGAPRRVPAERVLRRRRDRVPGRPEHGVPDRPRLRRSRPCSTTSQTEGGQAYIPLEQLSVLDDADVLLWATESPDDRDGARGRAAVPAPRGGAGRASSCSPTGSRRARSTSSPLGRCRRVVGCRQSPAIGNGRGGRLAESNASHSSA